MSSCGLKDVFILIVCMIVPNIPGFVYIFEPTYIRNLEEWYQNLNFPSGRPPDWLFGPVWIYLYTTMGIAHFLVFKSGGGWCNKVTALPTTAYILQLILNWIWTPIFFYGKLLLIASIEIVVLLFAVIITGLLFWRVNKISGLLFIPYVLWISYASQFCIRIYLLNK